MDNKTNPDYTEHCKYIYHHMTYCDIIWYTLLKLGVRGEILDIIMSIYEIFKTTCRVKYDNVLSDSCVCNLGVRQGESLLPFLFSMYLNDIEE